MPLYFRITFMTPPPSYFYRLGNWVHVSTPRAVWAQSLCCSLGPCPVPKRHWSPPPLALRVQMRVSVSDLVCVIGGSKASPASPHSACHTHRHPNVSWGAKHPWLSVSSLDVYYPSTALILSHIVLPFLPSCDFYLHKRHKLLTGTRWLFIYFISSLCGIPIQLKILITFF